MARGRADWATTGGSTPVAIYQALAREPLRDLVPWDRVHLWWGDDRFVPRDDPLSNVRPLDEVLGARPVPLRAEAVHPIPMAAAIEAGTGPAGAARAYEADLRGAGLSLAGNGFPILDIVLVGVGPDGHLFSVFPGSEVIASTAWVAGVAAPEHVEPHVPRVTLNPEILRVARLPLVVMHGAAKAEIAATVLGPVRDPQRWPAQLARLPGAVWILDRAAAARLAG